MNYHKLLNKQISKYLSADLVENPAIKKFLSVISDSYDALLRDKLLVERAFSISEEEYISVNKKLSHEVSVKRKSIETLKNILGEMGRNYQGENPDDFLAIAEYLNKQVTLRKSAEKVFTSLVENSHSGILLEDEYRNIVFTNQLFCDLFQIPYPPDALIGTSCSDSAEQSKHLFNNPDEFVAGIGQILKNRAFESTNLTLADGRILKREYIPIFIDDVYRGHLWNYTDITEKKKAMEALEQSELKNRLIMNSALDAIITIDSEGLITFWNPQAEKIFGWKEAEVIGKHLTDNIIPSYHKAGHKAGMERYHQNSAGTILNKMIEMPAMNKNGAEFSVELSIIPVSQGSTNFFCAFIRDISDRKKNEEELRASKELWQFALEGAGDGVWEYNFQSKKAFFSKKYKSMLGYGDENFANDPDEWLSRIHSDDLPKILETDEAYFSGEINSHQREYRILHKNGNYIWVLDRGMIVNRTPDGLPERIIGTHSDITERKLSEQALINKEEKYRNIITNMNLGLLEVDNDGYIQFANQTFCKMIGFDQEELAGAKDTDIIDLGESKETVASKTSLRKHGISDAYEVKVRNRAGELRWWLISGAPRLNDKGEHIGSVGIHLDITEQKKLEHELIKAKEAAEESTKSKEAFLANMSHEIRTPMNAISGMANQLSKTKLDHHQQFFLNTIRSSADNLLVIINDILDLSKIESGKLGIEKIGFEPKKVISHVMQVMQHRAEEKGLTFTNSFYDQRLSRVLIGDPYRLSQIMLNLVSNAIKFTPKGKVDIYCSVLQDHESEQLIEISVIDSGVGMEQTFVNHLFAKFSQEDNSITRKYGGTGLGMSISKELIELMGGEIKVNSEKNKGTTVSFNLRIPKGNEQDLIEKGNIEVDTTLLNGKQILITDDNETNRLLASAILGNFGAVVTEAANGHEALLLIEKNKFDLILMDVQMPEMDGLEATRLVREKLIDVPIIALTAFALKGDNQKCLDNGMDDYLSKPFEEEQLLEIASKWLGKFHLVKKEPDNLTDTPLYNLSKIEGIARGNTKFINNLVGFFIRHIPLTLKEINDAYDHNDFSKISKLVHRIKPSVADMGISSIKDELIEIENFAPEYGKSQRLDYLLNNINVVLNQVVSALQANIVSDV